jgi:hypothetical protein
MEPGDAEVTAEPVVDDWLEGLANTVRPLKPKKKGKKGKKGQTRRRVSGAATVAEAEGEHSDEDNDGLEGAERDGAVAGPVERLESKREPPETKAAEMVDEPPELGTSPLVPEPKKKGKRGKRNRKGVNRRENGPADDGEVKGGAADQVAGEGEQSDLPLVTPEHGQQGGERLAGPMGFQASLPAIGEGQEICVDEPPARSVESAGGEPVASGATSNPVPHAAAVEVVPEKYGKIPFNCEASEEVRGVTIAVQAFSVR